MFAKLLIGFIATFSLLGLGALGLYGISGIDINGDYHHHHHVHENNIDYSWYHCFAPDNEYCSEDYNEWCLEEGEIYCSVDNERGECFEYNEDCLEELDKCVQY